MISYKNEEEIKIMIEGGKRLSQVVKELLTEIRIGISTQEIDSKAERLIKKYGGESSFKKVKDYHWSTCLPINEQIVHTPPSTRIIKDGDLLTLDIGFYFQGFHTDFATSFIVGEKKKEIERFLQAGKEALYKAIDQAKVNNYLGQISQAIEKTINGYGYFVIKELTGHGIGRELHEDPFITGFLNDKMTNTLRLKPGLTLAIEVIYSQGTEKMVFEKGEDWSIITKDQSISGCFEHTIAITDKRTIVII